MELFTLGPDFQPLNTVENFESLIWSERYAKYGDFQLTSGDIPGMMSLLPRETYVGLRDSTATMIVENYKIQKPLRGAPSITVTGRTFETVLERRASVKTLPADTQRAPWAIHAVKESDAAYLAMRTVLGDLARYQNGHMVLPQIDPAVTLLDAIPEVDLTLPADYQTPAWSSTISYAVGDVVGDGNRIWKSLLGPSGVAGASNINKPPGNLTYWEEISTPGYLTWGTPVVSYDIKAGNLYDTVLELLTINRRGIKSVREVNNPHAHIEIYNGANLTGAGPGSDPNIVVVFDARFDQFDDATYLLSQQGSTNVGYFYGVNGSQQVLKNTAPEPSGLDRRVLLMDQMSDTTTDSIATRKARALVELYKYNSTAIFDGQVAAQIAEGYNKTYFLGDIIKLTGEFGLSQNVRVTEFIRSVDAQGEKAFPAFEAVDE